MTRQRFVFAHTRPRERPSRSFLAPSGAMIAVGLGLTFLFSAQACSYEFRLGASPTEEAGVISKMEASPPLMPSATPSCADEAYAAWHCEKHTYLRDSDGIAFEVEVRYNLLDKTPDGSVIWLVGGEGRGGFRKDTGAAKIQDLGASRSIRSVEIDFVGAGGYWAAPALGYVETGRLVEKIIRELQGTGIAGGRFATFVGLGEAATIGAAALARTELAKIVSRFVFLSGPTLSEASAACTNPNSAEFINIDAERAAFDQRNGWSAEALCAGKKPSATYAERSVFGAGGTTNLPSAHVHVILGAEDAAAPWILRANELWFRKLVAAEKSRYVIIGVGHDVAGGPASTASTALNYALDRLEHFALATPETPITPTPKLTFALTPGGPPITTATKTTTVYGRVENVASGAAGGCVELVDSPPAGACALPSAFTPISQPWVWDEATKTFSTSFQAGIFGGPGKTIQFWRDSVTQAHTDGLAVEVTN